jgi:TolB protein
VRDKVAFAAAPRGKIAFVSDLSGSDEVYLINADGTGLDYVTFVPGDESSHTQPALSPDGRYVAYLTEDAGGAVDLVVQPLDGSGDTRRFDTEGIQLSPVWSPDSKHLAYASDQTGNFEIFVRALEGQGEAIQLTNDPEADLPGSWSRDGIYFMSHRDGDREIYRMNADGTSVTRLTTSPGTDVRPRISPKGKQVLFESTRDGNLELYVMRIDGSNPVRITDFPGKDNMAAWSPNGKQIIFVSDRSGSDHLWIINADGSEARPLTDDVGLVTWPSWSR